MNTGKIDAAATARPAPHFLITGGILAFALAIVPMTNDTILAGIPALRREFGLSAGTAQLTLSAGILAFAFTQIVFGPLSDRFGRRPILIVSLLIYCAATVLSAIAPTFDLLLVGRALQGVGAAGAPVIARAVIRDIYGAERSGKAMSYVMSAFGVLAIIAPAVGGPLVEWYGWRSTFIFCLAYAVLIIVFAQWILRETLAPEARQAAHPGRIVMNMGHILQNKVFLINMVSNCAFYACMWVWLSGGLFLLIELVEVPVAIASIYFGLSTSGFMIGAAIAGRMASRFAALHLVIGGGAICLVASTLLWFFAANGLIGTTTLVLSGFLWLFGFGFYSPNTMARAVAPFPTMAGAASSLIGSIQMVAGAIAAYATGALYDGTSLPFALLMTGLTGVGLVIYVTGRRVA